MPSRAPLPAHARRSSPVWRGCVRAGALGGAASLVYACRHAWEDYDPRLSSSSSSGTAGAAGADGGPGWVKTFGPQIAVDAAGDTFVAANFGGTLQVDTWTVTAPGKFAIVLLELDPDGHLGWIRRFGEEGAYVTALGLDGTGDPYLAGQFTSKLQIEANNALVWPSLAGHDGMFVARIAH